MKFGLIFLLIGLCVGYFVRFLQEKGFQNNGKYDDTNYLWGNDDTEEI